MGDGNGLEELLAEVRGMRGELRAHGATLETIRQAVLGLRSRVSQLEDADLRATPIPCGEGSWTP